MNGSSVGKKTETRPYVWVKSFNFNFAVVSDQ